MKKIYPILSLFLFAGILSAQTSSITFQVDMTGQTVSANGVHIAGNFQDEAGFPADWDPSSTAMTNTTGNIYAVTVTLPDGVYEYKFINDNSWGGVEGVPSLNQVGYGGNDNRWVYVNGNDTLPAIEFAGTSPVGMNAVSMIVNLENESTISDTVSLAGSFQGWSPGVSRMALIDSSSTTYHYIHYETVGNSMEWKFINGTAWGQDESVPSACNVNGNRYFSGSADTIYDVCYAGCSPCFIPDTFDITINVDMNAVCGFDMNDDTVDIAGPFNGWPGSADPSHFLTDTDGDGVYTITVRAAGPEFEYKARYTAGGALNWEGGANNIITVSSDTIMDARCFGFDALGPCAPKPANADITFRVDMTQYAGSVTLTDMYVMGDFTGWQGNAIKMNSAGGGIFETTVADFCPAKIVYKYVINDPNTGVNGVDFLEEDFLAATDTSCLEPSGVGNYNRVFVRPDDQAHTLAYLWETCTDVSSITENDLEAMVGVYPNPTNGLATITLPQGFEFTLKVTDLTGKVVSDATEVTGSYKLDLNGVSAGVYLINLTSEDGLAVTRKLVLK